VGPLSELYLEAHEDGPPVSWLWATTSEEAATLTDEKRQPKIDLSSII
jgi:hypothetical protein